MTGRDTTRSIRPPASGETHLPGYRHTDDGTLCRTAARVGPVDPVCACSSGREAPRDPQDARFCTCGASRGHYGWWWSCEGLVKVLDAFLPESPPARETT